MADNNDIPCWPHWLQKPLQSGYSYTVTDTRDITDMEIGSLSRVVFGADQLVVSCSLILDTYALAFFETFERDLSAQGQKWFIIPLWIGGELREYKARFKGRPKFGQIRGLHTSVSFTLDVGARILAPTSAGSFDREGLPRWPDDMPALQREGYGYELADNTLPGAGKLSTVKRVAFTMDEARISARMVLDPKQAAFFERFERDTLNQGSRWFLLPVWIAGEVREYKARFRERPKLTELSGLHSVYLFVLDLENRELLDPNLVAWLLYFSPRELYLFADRLCFVINTRPLGCTTVPADVYTSLFNPLYARV